MIEEIESEKNMFRKNAIWDISIFWNPHKSFFDRKIHSFDPNTPKIGHIGRAINIFFGMLKNVEI